MSAAEPGEVPVDVRVFLSGLLRVHGGALWDMSRRHERDQAARERLVAEVLVLAWQQRDALDGSPLRARRWLLAAMQSVAHPAA